MTEQSTVDGSRNPAGVLRHQVAIVTGGSRGIGRAIAVELAGAGASVAVVGRSRSGLADVIAAIEDSGGHAIPIAADVTDRESVVRLVKDVRAQLGPPDVLVNNAGSLEAVGPIWEIDPDKWWADVEANLRSAALCAWAVLPDMVDRRRGTVINVASISGVGRSGYDSAYSAAKAGMIRLTSSLATETAAHGVRAFAVHPGTVRTALTQRLAESPEGRRHFSFFGQYEPDQWADPSRVARLCVGLASGQGAPLSGYFVDSTDKPSTFLWRLLGKLGIIWREAYAMNLCRALNSRKSGR